MKIQCTNCEAVYNINDSKINRYLEVRHSNESIETVPNYINALRNKSGCELFAIYMNKSQEFVGTLGITDFDHYNKRLEYGLIIGEKKARLIGVGTLATILLYEYIFSFTDIEKIHNPVVEKNKSSWKLVESLGSKREGILRKHFHSSTNDILDIYLYGILKEEWENQKNTNPIICRNNSIKIEDSI